jgi:hypothetical protein
VRNEEEEFRKEESKNRTRPRGKSDQVTVKEAVGK